MHQEENYQLMQQIGEGRYGVVYRARHVQSGKKYALKQIRLQHQQQGFPAPVLRQKSILKELSHPHIIKLEDFIATRNKIHLVFQLGGVDMKKYLSKFKESGLNQLEIKKYCHQLLKGVDYCHKKTILHRDLKPQNLLIQEENKTLKIADFGLSRSIGIPTKSLTKQAVTLWYRSPEILLGEEHYSYAIDIWSVGCILAEMISSKPLFQGKNQEQQINFIFKLLGTPNKETWPGATKLSRWNTFSVQKYPGIGLKNIFSSFSEQGLDLLSKMLQMNPQKRISAEQALKHEYFANLK